MTKIKNSQLPQAEIYWHRCIRIKEAREAVEVLKAGGKAHHPHDDAGKRCLTFYHCYRASLRAHGHSSPACTPSTFTGKVAAARVHLFPALRRAMRRARTACSRDEQSIEERSLVGLPCRFSGLVGARRSNVRSLRADGSEPARRRDTWLR